MRERGRPPFHKQLRSPVAAAALLFLCLSLSCASRTTIPLLRQSGAPLVPAAPRGTSLEVVTRSTAIPDPLPIEGSRVSYAELENALGLSVMSAAGPWIAERGAKKADSSPLRITVELVQADAREDGQRLLVGFGVRATLRAREGNVYIAQTQASCRQAALAPPEDGAPVLYSCFGRIAQDLVAFMQTADNSAATTRGNP